MLSTVVVTFQITSTGGEEFVHCGGEASLSGYLVEYVLCGALCLILSATELITALDTTVPHQGLPANSHSVVHCSLLILYEALLHVITLTLFLLGDETNISWEI